MCLPKFLHLMFQKPYAIDILPSTLTMKNLRLIEVKLHPENR